jgi:chromosomal replication initiation ATPase DnaA
MERIISAVSEFTGVSADDIMSRKRTRNVCEARQIFMYLSHSVNGESIVSIAGYINRTHQDVSARLRDFDQHLRIYRGLNRRVREIRDAVVQL